jgi:hypothetical protein
MSVALYIVAALIVWTWTVTTRWSLRVAKEKAGCANTRPESGLTPIQKGR